MLILQLIPIGLGLFGTLLMFLFSHSIESPPLAECGDIKDERLINRKNILRVKMQRFGMLLLCTSFLVQSAVILYVHFSLK